MRFRSRSGSFPRSFRAGLVTMSVQFTVEFIESRVLAALERSPTFVDGGELGLRRRFHTIAAFEIMTPCLTQELGARAMFLSLHFLHLLRHAGRQGDGHRFGCAHGWVSVTICDLILL